MIDLLRNAVIYLCFIMRTVQLNLIFIMEESEILGHTLRCRIFGIMSDVIEINSLCHRFLGINALLKYNPTRNLILLPF